MLNSRQYALITFVIMIAILSPLPSALAHKANKDARVFFVNLADGMTVSNPIRIKFGAKGIHIAPIGVDKHRTGHHHLLIDVANPISMDDIIPFDEQHIHYINGEAETAITLLPGQHTLQLVLGDEEHEPWANWLVSDKITITVLDGPSD